MQIKALKSEYRPFTREAAARVAKEFEIVGKEDVIFKRVVQATESYERYRRLPDYHQTKDALEKLSKTLRESANLAARYQKTLDQPLYGTVLRRLGELLTYDAIKQLGGAHVSKMRVLIGKVDMEDFEEETRLDRSIVAADTGTKLLVSLLREMQSHVATSLSAMPALRRGRRTKHLFRQFLITELARLYEWLFDKRPTSTAQGDFNNFCVVVLQEMEFDLTGLEDAIPIALKKAGFIGS